MAPNEVNLASQANLTPERCAWMIRTYMLPLLQKTAGDGGYKLVGPSTANGQSALTWYANVYAAFFHQVVNLLPGTTSSRRPMPRCGARYMLSTCTSTDSARMMFVLRFPCRVSLLAKQVIGHRVDQALVDTLQQAHLAYRVCLPRKSARFIPPNDFADSSPVVVHR